jgi:hypothetical protein
VITSGENSLQSMTRTITDDEVEFDFDSNTSEVQDNAEAINSDFIVGAEVKSEIFAAGASEALLEQTANCLAGQ